MKTTVHVSAILFILAILVIPAQAPAQNYIGGQSEEYTVEAEVIGIHKSFTLVREDHMWQRRVTSLDLKLTSFEHAGSETPLPAVVNHLSKNKDNITVAVTIVTMDDYYKNYRKAFNRGVKGNLKVKGKLKIAVDTYTDRTDIVVTLMPDQFIGDYGNWPEKE